MTPIHRPLTDDERQLMFDLAIDVVARQLGRDEGAAIDALNSFAAEGTLLVSGDAEHAYLEAAGKVLVHAERDWLAFHAAYPGNDPLQNAEPISRGTNPTRGGGSTP